MKMNRINNLALLQAGRMAALITLAPPALAASGATTLQATVTVTNPTPNCTLTVGQPSASMTANWTYTGGGANPSHLAVTGTEPPAVQISVDGDASCNINSLRLTTLVANAQTSANQPFAQIVSYTPHGGTGQGFWRFIPYLAQAKFYQTSDWQNQGNYTDIEYDDPSPNEAVQFSDTINYHAGETMTDLVDANYKFLTNTYVEGAAGALLLYDNFHEGTLKSVGNEKQYKSATLSFGALLASDPENASGQADPSLSPPDGNFNINWTVTITTV